MKFPRRPQTRSKVLDLTALMDVMFILLIFFMLNSQWDDNVGLSLELPQATQAKPLVDQHVEIVLDELDQLTIDGLSVNLGELEFQLEGEPRHRPILLRADRDASYGKAVSIFDHLEKLGFHRVALGTTPPRL